MSNFDLLLKQLQYVADLLPTLSSQEQEEAVTVIRDFSSQVTQLYTDPAHDIAESSLNPAMSGSTYGVDDNTMDHDDTVAAETDVDELNANEQVESLLELKETHFDAVDTSTPIADELGHVQENPTESAHELGHVVDVPTESGVDQNNEMTSFVILNGHEQETLTAPTEVFTETALACETISENVILSMPQDGLDENQSVQLNQQHFQDVIPKCESKEPNNLLPEPLCNYNMTDFSSMELANNDGMGPAEQIAHQSSPESAESSDVSCQKLVDDVPVTTVNVVDEVKKPMKTVRFMIDTPNAEPLPGRAQQKVVLLVLDEATQNQNFMSYSPGDSFTKQTTFGTPRACKICNKVMSNASNLKVHMRSHTSERPYQCSECTAGFTTRANLTRHEASHRGQRPHQCTVCGRGFLEKKTLVHHMRTHTGEKPYHCQHCQKTFRQLSSLRTHSLIHLGQKKYSCELCDKTFRTKAALTSHRSKHGKDKRFQCDICQEVFSKKSEALQHRNLHFSNPYKCERCSATFMYHSSYTTHYTSVHGRLESSSTDDSEDNAPPGLYLSTAGQPSTGQRRENSYPITRLFPDTTKRKSVSISDQRTSSSLADIADSVDESTPKLNFCGLRACRQKKGSEAMVQLRSGQMVLVKKSDIVPKPVNYQC